MVDNVWLGMRPGDLDGKRYARFWNPDMRPVPEHVRDALLHGDEASELGLRMEDAHQLLDSGHLLLETGTTVLADGRVLVACLTEMPDVTGAMFEWWMGWHYMEHQRYKLWHPRAHLANGTREMRGDDPDLSDREKYLTTHLVTEYIGPHLERIDINFIEPAAFMPRATDFSANDTSALVCAHVGRQGTPVFIGHIVHQIRAVPGGAEMRSRFWLGKPLLRNTAEHDLRNRLLGSAPVRAVLTPRNMARDMLVHCAMEMNHLASFLPALYAEYH